jgi:hypothetical protein
MLWRFLLAVAVCATVMVASFVLTRWSGDMLTALATGLPLGIVAPVTARPR